MIVLDASAAVDYLLSNTRRGDWVADRILQPQETLHAPSLVDVEVTSALCRLHRRDLVTRQLAERALGNLASLRLFRYHHTTLITRMWRLRDNVSMTDAAYVALAHLLGATLVTTDARLGRAAKGEVRIETFDDS
jgi:predicted nucleic acid-binding protein